jgi:hypothetical protein
MIGIESLPQLQPIPGFMEFDWFLHIPGGYEDAKTGEWVPVGEPGYMKRYIRHRAFPDAPDGKTGAGDFIFISLRDIDLNPPEAIADLIRAQRDIAEMSLRDLFERRGVPFPA